MSILGMKNKIVLACLLAASSVGFAASHTYTWQVQKVIDGDTVVVNAQFYPPELGNIHIRLKGVDTPEHGAKAKCDKERALADKAAEFTTKAVLNRYIEVSNVKVDKYGNRVVGNISVDGNQLASQLIAAGLAKPYNGGTKQSWCQ